MGSEVSAPRVLVTTGPQFSPQQAGPAQNLLDEPYQLLAEKDQPNGYPSLDAGGMIPVSEYIQGGQDFYWWRAVGPIGAVDCWYNGVINPGALGTNAPGVNTLLAFPFIEPYGGTLDRIAFNVTTLGAAGSKARVGIYTNVGSRTPYPNALLVDGGEFACDVATGVKSTTINQVLTRNSLYWLVYLAGVAAPTIRVTANASPPVLGMWDGTAAGTGARQGWTVARAYGALPDPFPAGATPQATVNCGTFVRYSA